MFTPKYLITVLGSPNQSVLLGRSGESCLLHGLDHLLDSHNTLFIRYAGEFLLKTHVCACDALQPFQGLLDHEGSGASRHAVDPQVSDGSL